MVFNRRWTNSSFLWYILNKGETETHKTTYSERIFYNDYTNQYKLTNET